MKYLYITLMSLALVSPSLFLLYSSIIHQTNTYDWWLVALAVLLFLIPLDKFVRLDDY